MTNNAPGIPLFLLSYTIYYNQHIRWLYDIIRCLFRWYKERPLVYCNYCNYCNHLYPIIILTIWPIINNHVIYPNITIASISIIMSYIIIYPNVTVASYDHMLSDVYSWGSPPVHQCSSSPCEIRRSSRHKNSGFSPENLSILIRIDIELDHEKQLDVSLYTSQNHYYNLL